MALQQVDRSKAKHAIKTASRVVPSLVNRSHKRTFHELAPVHVSKYGTNDRTAYQLCADDWWI